MIIARSPMRISLGGGGTDLPSYYRDNGGFVIAAAIDKYVYITLHEPFEEKFIVKYSKMEVVERIEEIQHPIIREALYRCAALGDHQHVRHPCRHRAWIVGKLYNCIVAGASPNEAQHREPRRTCSASLPH